MNNKEIINAVLRQDFFAFVEKVFKELNPNTEFMPNWHLHATAYVLMECFKGSTKRQIITQPPRSLKSIIVSVALPAWILGRNPAAELICISYAQELSEKLSRDFRKVVQSSWYKTLFPQSRGEPIKNTVNEYVTTENGGRYATSVHGTLTGRGGDFIIIDDFHKADETLSEAKRTSALNWYKSTVPSRLNNKETGVIIVVQQRLHEEDLVGMLLKQGNWKHLCLPVIAEKMETIPIGPNQFHTRKEGELLHPQRESETTLNEIKAQLGSAGFSAQYQQCPVSLDGNIILAKWFRTYSPPLYKNDGGYIVQSWDTANTTNQSSDYSVCTTWLAIQTACYLLHVFRAKLEYPDLLRKVYELEERWKADLVIIEQSPSSLALIQTVQKERGYKYKKHPPKGDKISRLVQELPLIEAGMVYIPEQKKAWLEPFLHELKAFPSGLNDDQVDSFTLFLYWYRTNFLRSVVPQPDTGNSPGSLPPSGSTPSSSPTGGTLSATVTIAETVPNLDFSELY